MALPAVSEPPWGFLEWFATGVSTFVISSIAFLWRLMARLDRLSILVDRQRFDIDHHAKTNETVSLRLSVRLGEINEDYHRVREAISALPSRSDLRDLEAQIGNRIESIAARFDRVIEKRG